MIHVRSLCHCAHLLSLAAQSQCQQTPVNDNVSSIHLMTNRSSVPAKLTLYANSGTNNNCQIGVQIQPASMATVFYPYVGFQITNAAPDTQDRGILDLSFWEAYDPALYLGPLVYNAKQESQEMKCADEPFLADQLVTITLLVDSAIADSTNVNVKSAFRYRRALDEHQSAIETVRAKYGIAYHAHY